MSAGYQSGDSPHDLLRKILDQLIAGGGGGGGGTVTLTASDIEIGAVEIKNGTSDTRLTVFSLANSNPIATRVVDSNGDALATFPISGTVDVSSITNPVTVNGTVTVGGTVAVSSVAGTVTIAGTVAVSSLPSIPAGTNNIGDVDVLTLPSIPAGTNNIGDVDVLTLPALPAGSNNIGDVDVLTVPAPLNVTGGGLEAAALRVTLASDSTGVLSVDDNGTSLTIDTTQLPAALVSGRLDINIGASSATVPISAASLPLPSGAAQEHTTAASPHSVRLSDGAAFYDSAKTGQLPAALVGSRLDVNNGAWLGSTAPTVGQKTMADSLPVTLASNQANVSIDIAAISYLGTFSVRDADALADNGNAFVDGTSRVHPAGFLFDETAGTALTENDIAAARIDSKRAQVIAIEDATTRGQRLAVNSSGHASVALKPQTSGGLTTFHLVSAGTTNASVVKNSAGQLYGWFIYNSNAAARKVAFHNSSSSPTAGASIFFTLVIPPTSGANVSFEQGIVFSSGIAITTVTGLADSDSAAVAANDLIINLFYA